MSHISMIQLEIKDLRALALAAKRLGMTMEPAETHRWYGTRVGNDPLPGGFVVSDLGKCTYKLSVDGSDTAYEVGVAKCKNGKPGYALLFDSWGGQGQTLVNHIGKDGAALMQAYGVEAAKRAATAAGLMFREQRLPNGTIKLILGKG